MDTLVAVIGAGGVIASMFLAGYTVAVRTTLNGVREMVERHEANWREFNAKGWNNLPADLADASALSVTINALRSTCDRVETRLVEHDEWERAEKHA